MRHDDYATFAREECNTACGPSPGIAQQVVGDVSRRTERQDSQMSCLSEWSLFVYFLNMQMTLDLWSCHFVALS